MSYAKKDEFAARFARGVDELRWLYMELYGSAERFEELCTMLRSFYDARSEALRTLDRTREENRSWYKQGDLMGMMLYIDNFAGNLDGVRKKLD